MADVTQEDNITRAMGLVPVNALTVTSVMGHNSEIDSEFNVNRLTSIRPKGQQADATAKTSGGQQVTGHRGTRQADQRLDVDRQVTDSAGNRRENDSSAYNRSNRGKGDQAKDGDKGHRG